MAKYGPKASQLVEREMKEMKAGKLRSGSGEKVTNPKQAIAIALSEARRAGAKMPPPPPGTPAAEKEAGKEASTKTGKTSKSTAGKSPVENAFAKKRVVKKSPPKKS